MTTKKTEIKLKPKPKAPTRKTYDEIFDIHWRESLQSVLDRLAEKGIKPKDIKLVNARFEEGVAFCYRALESDADYNARFTLYENRLREWQAWAKAAAGGEEGISKLKAEREEVKRQEKIKQLNKRKEKLAAEYKKLGENL